MIRSRIAPTPSGYLHVGNAVNFVLTWLWVRKENGIVRLRIDDRITVAVLPEHLNDIFDALHWLGLDWDEGPRTPEEVVNIYSQHLHTAQPKALLEEIVKTGKVYACTCGRKVIQSQSAEDWESCNCRSKNIPLDQAEVTWRIITPEDVNVIVPDVVNGAVPVNLYQQMHDFAVRKRDGQPTYHVVSLSDDIEHKSNLIIRGMDLLPSTAAQLFLAELTNKTTFTQAKFYHHAILTGEGGEKLSKSAGSKSLLRSEWHKGQPVEFYKWLSGLLGWKTPATSAAQMLQLAKEGQPLILLEK